MSNQKGQRGKSPCKILGWLQHWCHSQRFSYLDHGTLFEIPDLLGADGAQLPEKGKGIFAHRPASLVKRALNLGCQGRETSIHPTLSSVMPVAARDAQSLERGHRSSAEHLKSSTM